MSLRHVQNADRGDGSVEPALQCVKLSGAGYRPTIDRSRRRQPGSAGVDAGSAGADSVGADSVGAGPVDAGSVGAGSVDAGSVGAGSVDSADGTLAIVRFQRSRKKRQASSSIAGLISTFQLPGRKVAQPGSGSGTARRSMSSSG